MSFARQNRLVTVRRHLARRTTITAMIALVLSMFVLNVVVDILKPEWRDPEWGWRLKRLQALETLHGERPLCLVLGSSRTQMGLSPKDLGSSETAPSPVVYNLAQPGAGPLQMSLTYHRVQEQGIRPQAVLIEIMPAALATDTAAEIQYEETVSRLTLSELGWLRHHCENDAILERNWWQTRLNPWWTYRFLLISHIIPTLLPWQQRVDYQWRKLDDFGWLPFPFETIPESYREEQTAKVVRQYQQALENYQIQPRADTQLRDLIDRIQGEGIPVALFLMPEAESFRSLYPPDRLDVLHQYLVRLCDEKRVPLFNATDWLEEDAFSDGHHLMKHGARAFSQRFGAEFVRPWLENQLK